MKEQIQMLIELQGLDGEIFKRKRVIESVPGRLKQLDDELEKEKDTLKNLEEESKQIQVKRKEKEMDLEVKEAEIKKHQAQLMQVKTNKEYDALKKEIADRAADKSVLEEEIIAMLDEVDGIQKEVSRERDVVEEKKKKFDGSKKSIENEKNTNETEHNAFNDKRKVFVEKVDKNILAKYERILHNKDGVAVVPIENEACGGCNINLPPQVVNETKMRSELIFCGNCARILYTKE